MTRNKAPTMSSDSRNRTNGEWRAERLNQQHSSPSNNTQDTVQLLTRQYTQLSRQRAQWHSIQAERVHAMQEYSNGRRFFEASAQSMCDTMRDPTNVDSDAVSNIRRQLVDDGRRVSAKSDHLKAVEKQAMSTEWSMHRTESEIMTTLMALVPSCSAAAEWVRVMNESQVDSPRRFVPGDDEE